MRPVPVALALSVALAAPAAAQSTTSCPQTWVSSVQWIPEPWADWTRLYDDGRVRLVIVDTGEPAAEAWNVIVLVTNWYDTGFPPCTVVPGFGGARLSAEEAGRTGRGYRIPFIGRVDEGGDWVDRTFHLTLVDASGTIEVER
jgi:hypothetical protein